LDFRLGTKKSIELAMIRERGHQVQGTTEQSLNEIQNPKSKIGTVGYFDGGTTNGTVEGINNKLKLIKRRGYGFHNFKNFRLRSLLNWHFTTNSP